MELPTEYIEAAREAQRQFDSGTSTAESFSALLAKADNALGPMRMKRSILSGIFRFAPQVWLDANQ